MTNEAWPFAAFALVLIVGTVGLVVALARSSKRARNPDKSRSILDYLLVWPLLLEQNTARLDDDQRRRSRKRITVGWIFLVILIALAMYFHW
jgi:hypothetical protein